MLRPNRTTVGLTAVLLATLYAGLSQNNAAAFLLGYLLCSLAAVSALHAWANLRGLELAVEIIPPVFTGEPQAIAVVLRATNGRPHRALQVRTQNADEALRFAVVAPSAAATGELFRTAPERGRYETLELTLESTFPLGFFTVRRRFTLRQVHYVYPQPHGDLPLPADRPAEHDIPAPAALEGEDFVGVRTWRTGESMRHVDWKAVARGQHLMVKQWAGSGRMEFTLEYNDLTLLPPEARLSQLAQWLVQSERRGATYSLHLPSNRLPSGQGEAHLHRALRLLAEAPSSPPP